MEIIATRPANIAVVKHPASKGQGEDAGLHAARGAELHSAHRVVCCRAQSFSDRLLLVLLVLMLTRLPVVLPTAAICMGDGGE